MTTLTLLLLALRDYVIKNPGDTTINARRIDNMLLKNEYENGDERYKLLLTETDRDILISLVEEKPIAEGTRSRLIENYNFFANKLADKEIQPAEVYESIGKLQIVNITLDRTVDDAQAIFESLNSTGKELSESDLIRNYVLMGLEPSEQTYVYEHLYLNSVKAFFVMQDTYKEFPDNDKFEGAFVNRDIYNMRARNYILSRLENFENKAPITIENYTIEHIMPQNKNLSLEWQTDLGPEWQEVQKKYLHTIGNLTLTAYNSEMSDRPFLDKMDMPGGFKESALRLNKYVVLQNEWNEKHIQERANELAKKAETIWPYPTLTAAELAPYQAEEKTVQKYSLESYDVNAFTRMLFESLDKRIMNLSPAVKKEYKKLYVAYKLDTNFVDIVFQKQRLRISINMKFSEINDPNGICKDITGLGRWGNGDVELFMEHQDELDQIMEIVKQSYAAQAE